MIYKINTKSELEDFALNSWELINRYLETKEKSLPIPIYSSIDIRENFKKFAPIDHNLYPAGFNNLCCQDLEIASIHFQEFFGEKVSNIAIIPENHTQNTFYFDHLLSLKKSLEWAKLNVFFVCFDPTLFKESNVIKFLSNSGNEIIYHQGFIQNDKIQIKIDDTFMSFDAICLNNDQSKPLAIDWKNINDQVYPSPFMGWTNRKKSEHFIHYHQTVTEFGNEFLVNPDLLEAKFSTVADIDFASKEGIDKLSLEVDNLQKSLDDKNSPIFIKANQGTYGMGIMVVHSADEINNMNRKSRNKMDVGKNNLKIQSVLIQEGIETALTEDNMPAEITVYLVNGKPAGGFLRANQLKSATDNLNSKGMVFKRLCLSERHKLFQSAKNEVNSNHKKDAVYSVIARLSNIAAAKEILDAKQFI